MKSVLKTLHREAELQRRHMKWHHRFNDMAAYRLAASVLLGMRYMFMPEDNQEMGVNTHGS